MDGLRLTKAVKDEMIKRAYDKYEDQGLIVRTVDYQRQINYLNNPNYIAFDVLFPHE